ncbi:MAG: NACHT domain-containing protein, partial [bacterium]|nr:NACHT domain-containing protein [bacterium]
RLLGYKTDLDYSKDALQFDVRIERAGGPFAVHGLVECKDWDRPVGQREVREFASKVEHARRADGKLYQAILIARSGFVNNAHAVAATNLVELRTFQELLLSLVDLDPHLEAAVRAFQGTDLEDLYVEQDAVLQSGIRPGEEVVAKKLTATVREWLKKPIGTLFTLLGDFGSGKTSFCQHLACELALAARDDATARRPVVVDLREGGSTTVTLENLLIHRCQQLSSEPINAQALLHLNREGHLVLIFDGFDEIIGYSEPARFVENLRQILRACDGKAKVLLTCRTHYFRDQPEEVRQLGKARDVLTTAGATQLYDELRDRPGAEIGYLREFGDDEIAEYLRKALPPPADWQAFREEIRRTYNLEDLAERPFLLEMIVKTLP